MDEKKLYLGTIEPHADLLKIPPDNQRLYKIMALEHFIDSLLGNYLHFNRVDSYKDFEGADQTDGEQLPLDRADSEKMTFQFDSSFTLSKYYDQCRRRTYACCFSTENSNHIWENYVRDSETGKICIVFEFQKIRKFINNFF